MSTHFSLPTLAILMAMTMAARETRAAPATPPRQPAALAAATAPQPSRRAAAGLPAPRSARIGGGEAAQSWHDAGSGLGGLLHDRLVLGWRLHDPTLDETRRSYYIGTIDQLGEVDKEQELYVQAFPIRWLGLGLGYDRVSARTHTDSIDDHVDGTVGVKGVVLELYGRVGVDEIVAWFDPELARRHPWTARITPYIGFGRAYLAGGFDAETWWSEGYPSRAEWSAQGGGSDPRRAGTRRIDVGDDTATVSTLGVAIELYKGLGVDLSYRRVKCEVSAQYRYPFNAIRDTGSFDMSHDSVAIGLRYAF
jgi:opacity protein-like surface antigen